MIFDKILNTSEGSIIISIILGLGLASLFKKVCQDNNCVIVKSPPKNTIVGKIFKEDDKCYKYSPISTTCK